MVKAAAHQKKKIRKRTKKFVRHQSGVAFGPTNGRYSVKPSWRKPKGIDGRVRRRFRGTLPMPSIGYGTDKKTRHRLPNGFYRFNVNNVTELEALLMQNHKYCAVISHSVSAKKRRQIVNRYVSSLSPNPSFPPSLLPFPSLPFPSPPLRRSPTMTNRNPILK